MIEIALANTNAARELCPWRTSMATPKSDCYC